ncbi:MAG: hypothetical protein IBX47_10970 [Desulfuromonadales bacterium]|nr:hypothetical protein [Desulfuromonadales bacterium]
MKKTVLMLMVSLFLFSSNAFAVKFGAFLDVSGGSGEAEWESDWNAWDIDARTAAVGFVFDTVAADNRVFNYRMNIGIANQVLEDDYGAELDTTGFYVENIFGFALIKKADFCWWVGPLVRVGFYSGESENSLSDIDIDYFELGIGAVTGLNLDVGRSILSPSVGFRVSGLAGEGCEAGWCEDFEASTVTAFANIALLF